MRPMLERLRARIGRLPERHLADGGFCSAEDIEWAHGEGIDVYCPPTQSKHGTDPYLPRRGDGAGRAGLAGPDGERSRQGAVQAPLDLRMHPCPLAQLGPAAIDRARHRKGPRRGALVRAHQQHPARPSPRQRIKGEPSTRFPPTDSQPNPPSHRHPHRAADVSTIKTPQNPKASQALRVTDHELADVAIGMTGTIFIQ